MKYKWFHSFHNEQESLYWQTDMTENIMYAGGKNTAPIWPQWNKNIAFELRILLFYTALYNFFLFQNISATLIQNMLTGTICEQFCNITSIIAKMASHWINELCSVKHCSDVNEQNSIVKCVRVDDCTAEWAIIDRNELFVHGLCFLMTSCLL